MRLYLVLLLYVVIIFYSTLDAWQTKLLLNTGLFKEFNPMLAYVLNTTGSFKYLVIVKFIPIIFLGALIFIVYRKKEAQ